MKRENRTTYIILGFLNHENLTGYEIKKRIDYSLRFFWGAGFGQIYPTLSQMHEDGLVIKRSDRMGQKLERIIYSITDEGRKQLKNWLSLPVENEIVKYEILLKLFFGSLLDEDKNIENIMAFKDKYTKQLSILNSFETELMQIQNNSPEHLYYLLTVLFGEKVYKAYLDWTQEAIDLLEKSKIQKSEINDGKKF